MNYHSTTKEQATLQTTSIPMQTAVRPIDEPPGIWRHRIVQILLTLALLVLSLACYALLIIIFVSPSTLRIESLVSPATSGIKPTVAVALLSGVLAVVTGALATRAVEHYFWLRLSPSENDFMRFLHVDEVRNLAEWTVSPVSRLTYVIFGESWLLKLSGFLLLGVAVLNPVLVAGISETSHISVSERLIPRNEDLNTYAGYIHESNDAYNSGQFRDFPTQVAAALTLSNMSAPAETSICRGDRRCRIQASVAALHATCKHSRSENPDFGKFTSQYRNITVTSEYTPLLKANIFGGNPNQYAHFTSNIGRSTPEEDGVFTYILGVYIPMPENSQEEPQRSWARYIRRVDCKIEFGTKTISQQGSSSPELSRSSFEKTESPRTMFFPSRIYNEGYSSPFEFKGRIGGAAGESNIFTQSMIGSLLLGGRANVDEKYVAEKIEKSFDMATIMAWIRWPEAAISTTVYQETETRKYTFDWKSLLFLIVPLLAVALTAWKTGLKVGSAEDVVGYNPLAIADRGPVLRMEGDGAGTGTAEKEKLVARGVQKSEFGGGYGPGIVVMAGTSL